MNALSSSAIRSISQFDAKNLANTSWSFAKLVVFVQPLREAIAAQAIRKITDLQGQEYSNIAWSFSSLLFQHMPLMESIAAQSRRRIRALLLETTVVDEAAVLLWSFW